MLAKIQLYTNLYLLYNKNEKQDSKKLIIVNINFKIYQIFQDKLAKILNK